MAQSPPSKRAGPASGLPDVPDNGHTHQALAIELAHLRDAWIRLALTLRDIHFQHEQNSRPAPLQESQDVIERAKRQV